MAKAATGITAQIVEQVAKCGIQLVASLPDTWISDLIEAFDKDERFLHFGRYIERVAGVRVFDDSLK